MKKFGNYLKGRFLLIVMLLTLLVSIGAVGQVNANPDTVLSIKPAEVTIEPGQIFTVDVNITDVTNLYGYEFKLFWKNDVLKLTAAVRPSGHFLEPTDPIGIFVAKWETKDDFNATHGRFWAVVTLLSPEPSKSGSGILARLTFNTTNIGETPITFVDSKLADDGAKPILHDPQNGHVAVKIDIAEPTIAVSPQAVSATQRGEIIPINITITDLDSRWKAVGFEFKLGFDGTLLEAVDVAEGPFVKAFGETYMAPPVIKQNYVLVALLLLPQEDNVWTIFPEGNGTLATIFLNVTAGPPASTALTLYDTKLADITATPPGIIHTVASGEYTFMVEQIAPVIAWTDPVTNQTHTFIIQTLSNSSVDDIKFNQLHRHLAFSVSGFEGTTGFCNITIPKLLLNSEPDNWLVLVNGGPVTYNVTSNATHTSIYFTYSLSTNYVHIFGTQVIPEIPIAILPAMLLIIAAIAIILAKTTISKKHKHPTVFSKNTP